MQCRKIAVAAHSVTCKVVSVLDLNSGLRDDHPLLKNNVDQSIEMKNIRCVKPAAMIPAILLITLPKDHN